jgi:phosphoglycolate phosphatase-like HAD superfamily hydrolase
LALRGFESARNQTGLDDEKVEYFLPKVLTRMGEIYREMEKRPILNEGVEELLRILTKSQNHIVGVLTGNLSAVFTEKLRVTRIDSYFAERFCADCYFDRNRLIEDAVRTCPPCLEVREGDRVKVAECRPISKEAETV